MVILLILVGVGIEVIEGSADGLASDVLLYGLLALLGAWLTAGGPWLFGILRLSDAGSASAPA